ncbi:MAG: response regulator [Alphaproteobacteria bacterium]|nr:response regulator [Alphaproteobacteria bacterium]
MAMNCLIVDDSRVLRTVARKIFEEMRFEVTEAEDGMAALRACRERMPDVVLFDGNLPSMKSVDFLKSVRAQQGGGRPVILVATTENDAEEVAHAIHAGANEYLMKPFDRVSVRAKLAEIGVTA